MREAMLKSREATRLEEEASVVEMTVDEARFLIDQLPEITAEFLVNALDQAQGDIDVRNKAATYVVIRIVKEHVT